MSDKIFNRIEKAFSSGSIDEITYLKALVQYDNLEKAGHKYLRKIPDGKGGWRYIYKENESIEPKGHYFPSDHEKSDSHEVIRKLEKEIIAKTGQKYESCFVVRDGVAVYSKDGEKSKIDFTEDALPFLRGSIFTHNHPTSKCFSLADLMTTVQHGLSEMRAIAPDSIKGPVVFVFKNNGVPQNLSSSAFFINIYQKIDAEVKSDNMARIDRAPYGKEMDALIDECNQSHHIDVMLRMKEHFRKFAKKHSMDENAIALNKWEFYWERYEG